MGIDEEDIAENDVFIEVKTSLGVRQHGNDGNVPGLDVIRQTKHAF